MVGAELVLGDREERVRRCPDVIDAVHGDRLVRDDLDALVLDAPAVAIIKHANPCGVALGSSLKQPVLFDLRNVYRKSEAESAGLEYYGTRGRKYSMEVHSCRK